MHKIQINKKTVIFLIFFLTIVTMIGSGFYWYQQYQIKQMFIQKIRDELPYRTASLKTLQEKPFLINLPIYNSNYTVIYSSIQQALVIITKNDVNKNEIESKLKAIGVDLIKEKIIWTSQKK